jgi:type IV secretory pathway TraG/TraD family ATPase VirD4
MREAAAATKTEAFQHKRYEMDLLESIPLFLGRMIEEFPLLIYGILAVILWAAWNRAKGEGLLWAFGERTAWVPAPESSHAIRDMLSEILFYWPGKLREAFTIRDLTRSIFCCGASGSGKTTGSGLFIGNALVNFGRKISLLILSSKPEDNQFWQEIFRKAGRIKDLLIFSPQSPFRFNILDWLQKMGADVREIVRMLMVISESLHQEGDNRQSEIFWRQMKERILYFAVYIVTLANGRVTAPDLEQFIHSWPLKPEMLKTQEFESGYCNQCMKRAHENIRTSIDRHDYQAAFNFIMIEWPGMADKTRSSALADVMGTLSVFNSGIVRELLSTTTNISPKVFDQGMSVLVAMPISRDGVSGAFVLAAWKACTQWFLLKRQATEETPVCVLWMDEYQKVASSFDAAFLAECRSHKGCMVCLTQSTHSLYSRMHQGGEHETDSLLTNFFTKIAHSCGDEKTASYFAGLIGKRLRTYMDTSSSTEDNPHDAIFGQPKVNCSTRQVIENVKESAEFMQGLRTGGKENGYMVDGYVIRSGMPFSNGEPYLKVTFSQK